MNHDGTKGTTMNVTLTALKIQLASLEQMDTLLDEVAAEDWIWAMDINHCQQQLMQAKEVYRQTINNMESAGAEAE